jgi:hypothetical protein
VCFVVQRRPSPTIPRLRVARRSSDINAKKVIDFKGIFFHRDQIYIPTLTNSHCEIALFPLFFFFFFFFFSGWLSAAEQEAKLKAKQDEKARSLAADEINAASGA